MWNFIKDAKNRHFMRLWLAQLISQFGDRLNQMALIGLIAVRAPGSASDLAKLLSFTIIPVFIVGPVAGAFVDRWDKRRTLFVCDILRTGLVLLIPFVFMDWQNIAPIYGLVFLIFCFSRFYLPAKMSIIPDLVTQENLLLANSLMTTTGMIAFVLGCSLGGFLVDKAGAKGGFIGDAITFFVSAMLIISIKKDLRLNINPARIIHTGKEILNIEKSLLAEVKEGMRYLFTQKDIRFIINILFILLAAGGAVYVTMIIFIQQSFQSITRDLGVLAIFLGAGLFTGALLYGKWGKKFSWYKTIFFCLVIGGITLDIFAVVINNYPSLFVASLLALALGLIVGPVFIASNTIVHLVSDEKMRGKVFSVLEIVIHFAFLLAMLVSSFLSHYIMPFWILVGVGTLVSAVGAFGFLRYKDGGGLVTRDA
jgi:DHA3 family macrolide efflux protein-like MFS transporter